MKRLSGLLLCAALLLPTQQAAAQSAGFLPCNAASLSVTGASSNVQLSKCSPTALVLNIGTVEAFFVLGGTSATTVATTSNYSIPAGTFLLVAIGGSAEWIAAITASSTTTLRIIQGIGL